MKENTNIILEQIIDKKAKELSLEKKKRNHTGSIVSIFREEWHLWGWFQNPLVPALEIQCSISIEGSFVRAVWFPHPVLIAPEIRTEFVLLANEANLELHSGGRFWCNEDMDFAYEIVLAEEIVEKCMDEVAQQLFTIPYSQFQDLLVPLTMLKTSIWQSDTAIKYIKELRTKGVVDNLDYNLW